MQRTQVGVRPPFPVDLHQDPVGSLVLAEQQMSDSDVVTSGQGVDGGRPQCSGQPVVGLDLQLQGGGVVAFGLVGDCQTDPDNLGGDRIHRPGETGFVQSLECRQAGTALARLDLHPAGLVRQIPLGRIDVPPITAGQQAGDRPDVGQQRQHRAVVVGVPGPLDGIGEFGERGIAQACPPAGRVDPGPNRPGHHGVHQIAVGTIMVE